MVVRRVRKDVITILEAVPGAMESARSTKKSDTHSADLDYRAQHGLGPIDPERRALTARDGHIVPPHSYSTVASFT